MLDECNDENCPFVKEHAIGVEKVFIPKGWKGNVYIKQEELHSYLFKTFYSYSLK